MGESIWRVRAAYILSGETFDMIADASRGRLCTHDARVSPPTNQHTVAHNRESDLQKPLTASSAHPPNNNHGT